MAASTSAFQCAGCRAIASPFSSAARIEAALPVSLSVSDQTRNHFRLTLASITSFTPQLLPDLPDFVVASSVGLHRSRFPKLMETLDEAFRRTAFFRGLFLFNSAPNQVRDCGVLVLAFERLVEGGLYIVGDADCHYCHGRRSSIALIISYPPPREKSRSARRLNGSG